MFRNKTVVITGAANGIGHTLAKAYCQKGANVIAADLDEESGRKLTDTVNGSIHFVKTDVRKEDEIIKLMKTADEVFGGIDILINNAGVSRWKSPYDLSADEWDDIIGTNLRSVFLGSREAAKYMRKNENGGSIINLASTRATMSEPNSEAYAASKGGIVALTHALSVSLSKDRITVNAISPGWIETGNYEELREIDHLQHPSKRVGKPDDIARACFYLSSSENDFVTGINLVVDGGMTRKMIYEE
ncbi:SDR family NAD(P)-dependent oxidoreductase [Cytobacillus gottheilii]|uniref:SDR family NAD(P)-dependent oxidoreductase n=1 Tax=Cytobacillus gottheilii TaxID=859144 RepID=UPI0009BC6FB0|nr:glucose 1-dehydrogenase [Cytobacillus gottheilii]